MKRFILPLSILIMALTVCLAFAARSQQEQILISFAPEPSTAAFLELNKEFIGDWKKYGQVFTDWQASLFSKIFLYTLTILPTALLLHFIAMGAKSFSHAGKQILFFNALVRFIHWANALFFTLLIVTGLMIIFGTFFGGGATVNFARSIHIVASLAFTGFSAIMLLMWFEDMLPRLHDINWLFMMGGYLSREKKEVPAGKFNAGQKMWFWLSTLGGGVMAVTGYTLFSFQYPTATLRLSAIIHSFLGAALVGFYIIHLYMSLFAIKGALNSMMTGYKPEEEVDILHSKFKY